MNYPKKSEGWKTERHFKTLGNIAYSYSWHKTWRSVIYPNIELHRKNTEYNISWRVKGTDGTVYLHPKWSFQGSFLNIFSREWSLKNWRSLKRNPYPTSLYRPLQFILNDRFIFTLFILRLKFFERFFKMQVNFLFLSPSVSLTLFFSLSLE